MTLEQIQNLKVEDVFIQLLERVIDLSSVAVGQPVFTLHVDASLPFYSRVILHSTLVKPPLELLEAELIELKQELTDAENARLAEIARVEDIKSRFHALKEVRHAIMLLNLDAPNPALLLKQIIDTDDQPLLSALEASDAQGEQDRLKKKEIEDVRKIGALAVSCCNKVVEVIAGYNITRQLSKEQKDQMLVQFAPILQALQSYRPGQAKALIEQITPDGVLVTQDMVDNIMEVFGEYQV